MKSSSLLNPDVIDQVYSRQEYVDHLNNVQDSSRVALYPLHYMIALNSNAAACSKFAQEHRDCLVSRDASLHFLTPIMLAILLAKIPIVEQLAKLMSEQDFDIQDEFGFNALHLASIALPSMVDLLKKSANPLQLTPWNGNYRNLSILAGHHPPENPKCRFTVIDHAGILRDGATLNSADLEKWIGLHELRESALYDTIEGRKFLWQAQKSLSIGEQLMFQNFFESKIKNYKINPPKLLIKPSPKLLSLKKSLGVFADEKIPSFTKLSRYGGKFKESNEKSSYVLGKFDGREIGGLATLVNCGFPNSMFTQLHYEGDEQQDLFSIRELAPGEEILVSYGRTHIALKLGKQILLGVDELESFFRQFETNKKKSLDIQKALADPYAMDKIQLAQTQLALTCQVLFPLYYPNYLLYLWSKDITSASFWLEGLQFQNFPRIYQSYRVEEFVKECEQIKDHCQILSELEELQKYDEWGYIVHLKKWILENIGIYSYLELLCAILILKDGLKLKRLDESQFQAFFQSLPNDASELLFEKFKGELPETDFETFFKSDFSPAKISVQQRR